LSSSFAAVASYWWSNNDQGVASHALAQHYASVTIIILAKESVDACSAHSAAPFLQDGWEQRPCCRWCGCRERRR
jgi:hypothetical protein